jgi:3-oxoacyl-[acyl-carrier-protein] synthase-3
MPSILATATALPENRFETAELLEALSPRISDELRCTIKGLGVDVRHSVYANYAAAMQGRPASPTATTTTLAARAARECIERSGGEPRRIGLLVTVTNTPAELLPGLAPSLLADLHGMLDPSMPILSLQGQGCSALLKAMEVTRWFLEGHPESEALVVAAEVQTPLAPHLTSERFHGFRDIVRLAKSGALDAGGVEGAQLDAEAVVQAMLFGDGAVALRIGGGEGFASIGPVAHATNTAPEDAALLVMHEGGSQQPNVDGKPRYHMHRGVPARGAEYAARTVAAVLAAAGSPITRVDGATSLFVHTGSRKILDGVCDRLGVARTAPEVAGSYEVLRRHGNLSSASVGFMLHAAQGTMGPALVVSFGVGFSASAGVLTFGRQAAATRPLRAVA